MGTYLKHSPLVFVTQKGINNPGDLTGKKIMATTDELRISSLALMMKHFNIKRGDFTFVPHTFKIDDFINKKVDAMSAFRSNQLYLLDKKKIPYNIIDPVDYGFYATSSNLFTSKKEVQNNFQRAKKFIEASNMGWQYALEHQEEIIKLIYEKFMKILIT